MLIACWLVKDLRITSDHVQIRHSFSPFGSWAMLKYSLSITLDLSGFKEIEAIGLKTWTGTHCAHLISCYSLVFPSQCASECYPTVYYSSDICVCPFLLKAHGKMRGPFFLETATRILDSQDRRGFSLFMSCKVCGMQFGQKL